MTLGLATSSIEPGAGEDRAQRVLFTVGHSTHEADEFVALLNGGKIEAVADVRRHPGSRRYPHFNPGPLAGRLADAGIGYVTLGAELGGRRQPQSGSANDGWRVRQFQGYADHMASPAFASGIAALLARAAKNPVAAMCAEGDWRRCHRRLIADAALVRGFAVQHLLRDGAIEPHRLTEFAVVDGTTLTYPAQPSLREVDG